MLYPLSGGKFYKLKKHVTDVMFTEMTLQMTLLTVIIDIIEKSFSKYSLCLSLQMSVITAHHSTMHKVCALSYYDVTRYQLRLSVSFMVSSKVMAQL